MTQAQRLPRVLVYALSDIAPSSWYREMAAELEQWTVHSGVAREQIELHERTDQTWSDFTTSISRIKPTLLILCNPIMPDPRNPARHVAVFRSAQRGSHDLVSLTEMSMECGDCVSIGMAVDDRSSGLFEATLGSMTQPALGTNSRVSPSDERKASHEALFAALQDAKFPSVLARRVLSIATNRDDLTSADPPLGQIDSVIEDVKPGSSEPPDSVSKSPVWEGRSRSEWRTIGSWPAADGTESPFNGIQTEAGFTVVSWVRVGNRNRQVWVDTRKAADNGGWPVGPGWLMGTLQYKTTRPALLFQLNTGPGGQHGWKGQNFVAKGNEVINDGQWHSLAVVVERNEVAGGVHVTNVQMWVDGNQDHPQNQPHNPGELGEGDYFPKGAPLLLGESRDTYREGATTAIDFHGDLAGVGVYKRALDASEIQALANELQERVKADWQ